MSNSSKLSFAGLSVGMRDRISSSVHESPGSAHTLLVRELTVSCEMSLGELKGIRDELDVAEWFWDFSWACALGTSLLW